jgi:hypothetical protein
MAIEIKNRFSGAVIRTVDAAKLSRADLSRADLYGANLRSADLRSADLSGANLSGANLSRAKLSRADLSRADLRSADLSGANLSGANLRSADLSGANLSGADLSGANLSGASLSGANLSGAIGLSTFVVAGEGALVGYKKVAGNAIVELAIPRSAKRVNAYGSRKCRAEYAVVVSAPEGGATSQHDSSFIYRQGETVRPSNGFCDDPRIECAPGIHFFITEQEAVEY